MLSGHVWTAKRRNSYRGQWLCSLKFATAMRTVSLVALFALLVPTIFAFERQAPLGEVNAYSNWPDVGGEAVAKNVQADQWLDEGRDFIRQSNIVCKFMAPFALEVVVLINARRVGFAPVIRRV
jgi:hypothetical protein